MVSGVPSRAFLRRSGIWSFLGFDTSGLHFRDPEVAGSVALPCQDLRLRDPPILGESPVEAGDHVTRRFEPHGETDEPRDAKTLHLGFGRKVFGDAPVVIHLAHQAVEAEGVANDAGHGQDVAKVASGCVAGVRKPKAQERARQQVASIDDFSVRVVGNRRVKYL
jgi:hypothetical protein